MEFHSGLLRQAEEAFDNYDMYDNHRRLPTSK